MTRMEIVSGLKALQAHYDPTSPNHAVLEAALARIESRVFCEFFDKVRDMRMAQCAYFSTRTTDNLNRSKTLERQVDELIRTIPTMGQPKPQALPGFGGER